MNSFSATFKFIRKHYKKEWKLLCLTLLGITVGLVGNLGIFYSTKLIIDAIVEKETGHFLPMILAFATNIVGWRVAINAIIRFEPRVMRAAIEDAYQAIHRHSFNFFNNEFVGSLVKKANRMTSAMEDCGDILILELYTICVRMILALTLLFVIHPPMGWILLVWSVFYFAINFWAAMHKIKVYDTPENEVDSEMTGLLADSVSNALNVKLFGNFPHEKKRFHKISFDWMNLKIKGWQFNEYVEMTQHIAMAILHLGLLYFAVQIFQEGQLSVGDFVLLSGYLGETMIFIWDFGRNARRLYRTFADMAEMVEIMEQPIEVKDKPKAKKLKVKKGEILLDTVNFQYEGEETVFQNFSMQIKAGEHIALIGPSGGGKTTLIKLLLRLFDLQEGHIRIDGQDISKVTQDSLRKSIALVPQDPLLFHRSLMENIRYGRLTASDKEVIKAAKLAHCHEFISRFPHGYATMVGERGVKLSGGERQRIAIARAILSDAKILILDEATSNLDVHSEELIQDAIRKLIAKKTAIVIAHRLSTVAHMDRIIVLENGSIIEEGTHKALLKEKGLYARFWDLSQKGVS